MSRFKIQNASAELALPETEDNGMIGNSYVDFIVSFREYTRRVRASERYGKPGASIWGDRQSSARSIQLQYNISNPVENPESYYYDTLNEILAIFDPETGPWYLVDINGNRRCEIEFEKHSDITENTHWRAGNGTIDLIWVTGLWEAETETEVTGSTGGLATGDTFTVDNTGKEYAYPEITLTALDDVEEFTLRNVETGIFTRIGNNEFVAGSQMVISSVDGTIRLNGVEVSRSLATGSGFIYLQAGENTIQYESIGGSVRLDSLTFRPRWIN